MLNVMYVFGMYSFHSIEWFWLNAKVFGPSKEEMVNGIWLCPFPQSSKPST